MKVLRLAAIVFVVVIGFIVSLLALYSAVLFFQTPPILRGAYAVGGFVDGCPSDQKEDTPPIALSPPFNDRLAKDYPAGTPAATIVEGLKHQGFSIETPRYCKLDPSVETATIVLQGYGSTQARAYWGVDYRDKILWTRGVITIAE